MDVLVEEHEQEKHGDKLKRGQGKDSVLYSPGNGEGILTITPLHEVLGK